jgi:uncharacterized protein (DUF1697 family)
MLTDIGFADVTSLLQSGNVVFTSTGRGAGPSAGDVERTLEREIEARLGLRTDVHVRSATDLAAVIAGNPFRTEAHQDPAHLLVLFLKDAPRPGAVKTLQDAITGRERVAAHGRHAYLVYPDGMGRSRLTTALLDKHLGGRGTGRNWNTVTKLANMMDDSGGPYG